MKIWWVCIFLACATIAHGQSVLPTPEITADYQETALTGSISELADITTEIAPLDTFRILDQPALIYAARNFEPDRLSVIIDSHSTLDITDDTGTTAVMHALMAGRVDNAELLHQRGASLEGVNARGYSVRVLAEEAGLFGFGPEYPVSIPAAAVDTDDANQLLLLAAEAGDTPLIDWALNLGADLSAQADNGLQAAHLAALGGHAETFDHILSHDTAPREWATIRDAGTEDRPLTVLDFIIAGEGGGSRARAGHMLARAGQVPSLADQMTHHADHYRDAMMTIGYPMDVVVSQFGLPDLPKWDIGIPARGSVRGGTRAEWRELQRFLAAEGLYTSNIDGIPGRGTLRAIVFHVARHLPDLFERVEVMQGLSRAQGSAGADWLKAFGRWHLTQKADERGNPLGYIISLPPGMTPSGEITFTPMGQRYTFRPSEGRNKGSTLIQFTYSTPDRPLIAWFSLLVLGEMLDVALYEDKFTYQLHGVTRKYTATEDIPRIADLKARENPSEIR